MKLGNIKIWLETELIRIDNINWRSRQVKIGNDNGFGNFANCRKERNRSGLRGVPSIIRGVDHAAAGEEKVSDVIMISSHFMRSKKMAIKNPELLSYGSGSMISLSTRRQIGKPREEFSRVLWPPKTQPSFRRRDFRAENKWSSEAHLLWANPLFHPRKTCLFVGI
ncbi:hypothetical protein CEXT_121061 [Caerostris extrusa]|uniref:Uncharacterized protein n=1 Tax=Caerostris extrusa TaxID=172846 RepID=A0AAV4QFE5_CAEEX|nr:hypothetical protein CEXT_121061 [Caerostris extrusa]